MHHSDKRRNWPHYIHKQEQGHELMHFGSIQFSLSTHIQCRFFCLRSFYCSEQSSHLHVIKLILHRHIQWPISQTIVIFVKLAITTNDHHWLPKTDLVSYDKCNRVHTTSTEAINKNWIFNLCYIQRAKSLRR